MANSKARLKKRGSSNSKKVTRIASRQLDSGRTIHVQESLSQRGIGRRRTAEQVSAQRRYDEHYHAWHAAHDYPDEQAANNDEDWEMMDAVLAGEVPMALSHEGGEFEEAAREIEEEWNRQNKRTTPRDYRTRQDRTERRNLLFTPQMEDLANAYMTWEYGLGDAGLDAEYVRPFDAVLQGTYSVRGVDMYNAKMVDIEMLAGDPFISTAFVRQGYLPCAPINPTVGVSLRTLEVYRLAHLRCPHLAIQPWVKTLCDIHGVPFRSYLSTQFSIAFDLYLSIRRIVASRVRTATLRNAPEWRLKNICPACSYKLEGEAKLIFDMLFTMDGGESIRRILRRKPAPLNPEDGEPVLGASSERTDSRVLDGSPYLSREKVDRWAKGVIRVLVGAPVEVEQEGDDGEENPCAGRWKNMINELTSRMWGIFDETGIFLALCRHGFVLVIADMVRSGELAKYPLAIVEALLNTLGPNLGGGYDIGCKFGTTLNNSELGPLARQLNYTSLVGAFHGHAHNRLCQLSSLATYVKGMGAENLEGCERFFSVINGLAGSLRYASAFHRQQAIVGHIDHTDTFDTYHALSKLLCNNYRQAVELLKTAPALAKSMADQGINDTAVFEQWLVEEREYLQGLAKEPINETVEMDYYQALVNLNSSEAKAGAAEVIWFNSTPETQGVLPASPATKAALTERRHTLENRDTNRKLVQDLEKKLGITERWAAGSPEWQAAATMVGLRRYQRALDSLEGLIVARMFELTKMNMSQTGYKLRTHIAKALQARSQAIRTALDRYNTAAKALSPPRTTLDWNAVVEYAFLADFDLLRDTRQDVRDRPWARPGGRLAMDQFFKMERAREEIARLNVEIPRVVTYIRDERLYLQKKEEEVRPTNPPLAHQIHLYRMARGRFDDHHMHNFIKLSALPEFTGSIRPGVRRKDDAAGGDVEVEGPLEGVAGDEADAAGTGVVPGAFTVLGDETTSNEQAAEDQEAGEDQEGEDQEEEVLSGLFQVFQLSSW